MTSFLLVTDLDNTLVGDNDALSTLNDKLRSIREAVLLVYSTGRTLSSYQELRASHKLLEPDALVVSVGTEIYQGSEITPDLLWSEQLQRNWNRAQILDLVSQKIDLSVQPESEQGLFKISFYITADQAITVVPQLQALLETHSIEAKVIYSAGQHLDIVPQQGDKGEAMQFLRQRWQISAFRTLVCGNSGNDIALFKSGAERGVIVGNAQPELLDWHEQNPFKHHYLAQGHCAAGILEGLDYFRFLS